MEFMDKPLSVEQLDLILKFNDAIQEMAQKQGLKQNSNQTVNNDVLDAHLYPSSEDENNGIH